MWLLENFRVCLEIYWTVRLLVILMGAVQGPVIEHSGMSLGGQGFIWEKSLQIGRNSPY